MRRYVAPSWPCLTVQDLEKLAAASASSAELSQVNANLLRDLSTAELRLEESAKEQSRSWVRLRRHH